VVAIIHRQGGGSLFLAPLIGAAIATTWGWRGSFIALAVPSIVLGIVFYVLLGQRVDTKKTEPEISSSQDEMPPTPGHRRRLISFMALATINHALLLSTTSFIPLFMVDHFGVAEGTAAAFIAIIFLAQFVGSPLGGYLSDRLGRVPVMLVVSFVIGPLIYLLNLASYGLAFGVLLFTIGMFRSTHTPVSEAYIISQTSKRHRSTILGIYHFCSMAGGGILTPVVGYLIDKFDFYPSFTIVSAALIVVTVVCGIFLWGSRD